MLWKTIREMGLLTVHGKHREVGHVCLFMEFGKHARSIHGGVERLVAEHPRLNEMLGKLAGLAVELRGHGVDARRLGSVGAV